MDNIVVLVCFSPLADEVNENDHNFRLAWSSSFVVVFPLQPKACERQLVHSVWGEEGLNGHEQLQKWVCRSDKTNQF